VSLKGPSRFHRWTLVLFYRWPFRAPRFFPLFPLPVSPHSTVLFYGPMFTPCPPPFDFSGCISPWHWVNLTLRFLQTLQGLPFFLVLLLSLLFSALLFSAECLLSQFPPTCSLEFLSSLSIALGTHQPPPLLRRSPSSVTIVKPSYSGTLLPRRERPQCLQDVEGAFTLYLLIHPTFSRRLPSGCGSTFSPMRFPLHSCAAFRIIDDLIIIFADVLSSLSFP